MFFRPTKKDGVDAKERALWGDLISLGMVFPIAIVLGYFIGRWVGGMFGKPYAGRLIGLALGVMAGFWELFKVSKRLERYDKSNETNTETINGDNDGNDAKGSGDGT
jgi:F0F1-type ATP synthase assembly protein I